MSLSPPSSRAPGPMRRPPAWLLVAALVPVALAALPLLYVVSRGTEAGLTAMWDALARPRTGFLLANTLGLAIGVTLASTLIGTACAWVIERTDLPGRRWWRTLVCLPLAVPAFVSSYAWASLGPGFQGLGGAILILTLSHFPLIYLPAAAALRRMDTRLEDVARSLGETAPATFRRVVLPQLRPALGGGALLVLSHMLAEFGALSLLRVQTFTTAIFQEYELQFNSANAALLSGVLMALCLPVALGEARLRGRHRLARTDRRSRRQPPLARLGRAMPLVQAGLGLLTAAALGVPLAMLAYWLRVGFSIGAGTGDLPAAIAGSLELSIGGAVLTTLLALPLVLLVVRYRSAAASLAERLPYVVHGLPGLVVALALIYASIRWVPALYQSAALVLIAYAILFLPLAQSGLRAAAELVPPELEQAARTLGRGPLAAFAAVTLPALAPGIGAAMALIVLELMRELTATLLLAPAGVTTLATEVWSYTNDGSYAAAAPFAALLVLVSGVPVYVFTLRTLKTGRRGD
ncbi:iron ABC transporter permease [Bosea sp. 117]|uniref:ABC transporter permease n=1 Tax=Bosea sp. 117 TaxID=1125973 RepID=UPI0005707E88|nr:iron ABC transporter permease [Bosea sp. 117]